MFGPRLQWRAESRFTSLATLFASRFQAIAVGFAVDWPVSFL